MAILVAGGKGFIGSQVIRRLLDRGEAMVCFEPRATPGRIDPLANNVAMEVGSIANLDDALRVFDRNHITCVAGLVFFAFRDNPALLHQEMSIMVQGTANLFEAARRHGITQAAILLQRSDRVKVHVTSAFTVTQQITRLTGEDIQRIAVLAVIHISEDNPAAWNTSLSAFPCYARITHWASRGLLSRERPSITAS